MSKYKYAIIVPNYNNDHGDYKGKTFLRNCIESILNQTYKDFTLIIVDDMSDDTSIKTIKSYKDKRIKLIRNVRKRYNGGSRNVGIEYALSKLEFQYFCFLDSDDWWKHDRVLEMIDEKMDNHELMTLGCELLYNNGVTFKINNKPNSYEELWSITEKETHWCTAWDKVIRRDKIVYFCENTLMEDRVWSYRLIDGINFDKVISLLPIVYVWNRTNTTSVSQSKSKLWKASAFCHIGHQIQLIEELKHKEMIPLIQEHIKKCLDFIKKGVYEQK